MKQYRFDAAPASTHTLLLERVPVGSRVLEIGTASGYLGEYLVHEKKCEVWGIEPVQELFEDAQKCGYAKLFHGSVEEILRSDVLQSEKFDVLLCGDVLEHMADPLAVLKELKTFLKPGGKVVISLPNIAYISIRKEILLGRWEMKDAGILDRTHLRFFTKNTALEMVEKAGLKVLECRPSNGALERFGLNKLFGIGKKVLFFWPTSFAIQFVISAKRSDP